MDELLRRAASAKQEVAKHAQLRSAPPVAVIHRRASRRRIRRAGVFTLAALAIAAPTVATSLKSSNDRSIAAAPTTATTLDTSPAASASGSVGSPQSGLSNCAHLASPFKFNMPPDWTAGQQRGHEKKVRFEAASWYGPDDEVITLFRDPNDGNAVLKNAVAITMLGRPALIGAFTGSAIDRPGVAAEFSACGSRWLLLGSGVTLTELREVAQSARLL